MAASFRPGIDNISDCILWFVERFILIKSSVVLAVVFINDFSVLLDPDLALLTADSVLIFYTNKSHFKEFKSSCLILSLDIFFYISFLYIFFYISTESEK